jgi:hypothetical protein
MEIVVPISAVAVFDIMMRLVCFGAISLYWSLFCLFPRNDQPTSKSQKTFYIITEVLLFVVIFGIVSFKFV